MPSPPQGAINRAPTPTIIGYESAPTLYTLVPACGGESIQYFPLSKGSTMTVAALYAGASPLAQHGDFVQRFPGRIDISATKVAKSSGWLVDRATQIQCLDDAGRPQVKMLIDQSDDLFI
jgi:hypothetical protein